MSCTAQSCTQRELARCKSELYQAMPGCSAAESLRYLETDRTVLIRRLQGRAAAPQFLFNVVKAVLALRNWAMEAGLSCHKVQYEKLRDWTYQFFEKSGNASRWNVIDDWFRAQASLSVPELRYCTLDDKTSHAVLATWNALTKKIGSDTQSFWFPVLNQLPQELLAFVWCWTQQPV